MTDSYGCFSAYNVAFADTLPYRQLFIHIQREMLRAKSVTNSSRLKIT